MVRCKFRCDSVTKQQSGADSRPYFSATFVPVYSNDPSHPNKAFWDATPSGKIELLTTKEQASFVPGAEYFIDIASAAGE